MSKKDVARRFAYALEKGYLPVFEHHRYTAIVDKEFFPVIRTGEEIAALRAEGIEVRVLGWGGFTTCALVVASAQDSVRAVVARGKMNFNTNRQYNKRIGRVASLGRALKAMDERRVVPIRRDVAIEA